VGELPGVRKGCVAVFGTTARGGGTERVIVVAETGQTDAAARAALRNRIAALAALHLDGPADEVLLVPPRTVLKTSSGKIRRAACRELYEGRLLEAPRRAVWLQLARLVVRAAVARASRAVDSALRVAYGLAAWALFAPLAAVVAAALCVLPGEAARYALARGAAALLLRLLGLFPRTEGLEHLDKAAPAVVVANHASYLDAIVLIAALPVRMRFAAKSEFARMPVFGWLLRRVGTRFVERADAARGVEDTQGLVAAVARGETIALFPEGGFSRAPGLGSFRLGAFAIAAETGVPVVPVALRGTRSVLRAQRWLPIRAPLAIEVLPPLACAGRDWSAAVALCERVRATMLPRCGEPDLARGP
jgi:1-acyl-sn-glycerol-3-phosphate acyltransferase